MRPGTNSVSSLIKPEKEMDWITFRNDFAKERFEEAKAHAETHDELKKTWLSCMTTLENLSRNMKGRLELIKDFAPLSLTWGILREDGECVYNGGLIYHGPGVAGHEFPVLAVTLDSTPGWQIHS